MKRLFVLYYYGINFHFVVHYFNTNNLSVHFSFINTRAIELQETKYCMPYPTPVFKQHYMLQELGMACNTWFLVVRARLNKLPERVHHET